jgi:nitrogen regulatory protein P-II 2
MHQSMKFVIALVGPIDLDNVLEALTGVGVQVLTATETRAYSGQKGRTEFYRGAEYTPNFVPMFKLEIAVSRDQVGKVTDAIVRKASASEMSDSKIFVFDLDDAARPLGGETVATVPRRAA